MTQPATRICPACDREFSDGKHTTCPDDGSPLLIVKAEVSLIGRVISGRFAIERLLGRGGMGAVYLARQQSVGRSIALKIMHPRAVGAEDAARRFVREARLSANLTHPNIVTVLDFGQEDDGTLFIAMEYLEGPSLDAHLASGPFPPARAARIGVQICDALTAAHTRGIIHRDLKPENVIVIDPTPGRDAIKVVDFGLARSLDDPSTRLTNSGVIFGTAAYISPEMVLGHPVDHAADLYALGIMLFELVEGRLPFSATTPQALALMHAATAPPAMSPSVPAAYQAIVARLLLKDPRERFATAAELRGALMASVGAIGADLALTAPSQAGARVRDTFMHDTTERRPEALVSMRHDTPPSRENLTDETPRRRARAPMLLGLLAAGAVGVGATLLATSAPTEPSGTQPTTQAARATDPADPVPGTTVAAAPIAPRPEAEAPVTAEATPGEPAPTPGTPPPVVDRGVDTPQEANDGPSPGAVPAGAEAEGADAPPTTPADVAAVATVSWTFESALTATVTIDGERVGRTPLTLALPRTEATRVVAFSRPGHKTVTQRFPGDADLNYRVVMKRRDNEGFMLPE